MSIHAELLALVLASPDDDAPRLVYADKLEDEGKVERAELIRAQCELARIDASSLRAKVLRHQVRILLARNGRTWTAELPTFAGLTWGAFRRGFVEEVRLADAAALAPVADAVRAAAPVSGVVFQHLEVEDARITLPAWVRTVAVSYAEGLDVNELLDSGIGAELRTLRLRYVGIENDGAMAIAQAAARFPNLEVLDLTNGFVGAAGATALVTSPHLSKLRELDFTSHGSGYVDDPFVTDAVLDALATSPAVPHLATLCLGGNAVTGAGVNRLLRSPHRGALQTLSVRYTNVGAEAWPTEPSVVKLRSLTIEGVPNDGLAAALAACPQLSALEELVAGGSGLGEDGFRALGGSPIAKHLTVLRIAHEVLGVDGVRALVSVPWPALHTLSAASCGLDDAAMSALAGAEMPSLVDLDLSHNPFGEEGARALASARFAASLVHLRVDTAKVGAAALTTLLRAVPHLRVLGATSCGVEADAADVVAALPANVVDVDFRHNTLGDAGVEALSRHACAPNLVRLGLGMNSVGLAGAKALASGAFVRLGELDLAANAITEEGLDALFAPGRLPMLRSLDVSSCRLAGDVLDVITSSPMFAQLRRLRVQNNHLTNEQHQRFQRFVWAPLGADWVSEEGPDLGDLYD